jgi:hypothetical protein
VPANAGGGEPSSGPLGVNPQAYPARGRVRRLKSLVGVLEIRQSQSERLGIKAYSRLSGGLEKANLRLSANESFQDAEDDIAALTGMRVGHSTQQRLVGRQSFECAEAKQGVSEVSIDGGKVRLRDLVDSDSPWRDYKAVRVPGIYFWKCYVSFLSQMSRHSSEA